MAGISDNNFILNWFYDSSPITTMLLCSAMFVILAWAGIVVIRPWLMVVLKGEPDLNQGISYFLSFFNLVDGLLLSLLAVATYQNHANVERIVVREAAMLAALYHSASALPLPHQAELQGLLRDYTRHIVDTAWPQQQRGQAPHGDVAIMNEFQKRLLEFEPTTKAQELIFAATLRQLGEYVEARQQRLFSARSNLPLVLWYAVGVGIVIHSIFLCSLDLRLRHYFVFATLISLFNGTVICMILLLNHPFRGPFGVSAAPFALQQARMTSFDSGSAISAGQPDANSAADRQAARKPAKLE